jgi:hypothetical protein
MCPKRQIKARYQSLEEHSSDDENATASSSTRFAPSSAPHLPAAPVTLESLSPALRWSVERVRALNGADLSQDDLLSEVLDAALEYLRGVDKSQIFARPVSGVYPPLVSVQCPGSLYDSSWVPEGRSGAVAHACRACGCRLRR